MGKDSSEISWNIVENKPSSSLLTERGFVLGNHYNCTINCGKHDLWFFFVLFFWIDENSNSKSFVIILWCIVKSLFQIFYRGMHRKCEAFCILKCFGILNESLLKGFLTYHYITKIKCCTHPELVWVIQDLTKTSIGTKISKRPQILIMWNCLSRYGVWKNVLMYKFTMP